MSTYRYVTTHLVTGQTLADSLPLHVESFGRNLGGVGQPGELRATLDLGASTFQSAYLGALEPRRTLLWVLQDEYPVWAGIVWDWPHASAASDQLPILANELGSLFNRRQIRTDQAYGTPTGVDQYTIIRSLINYGLARTNGNVAQLVHTTNLSGITTSATFPSANLATVGTSANQFASQNSIEYAWDPGYSAPGVLAITLRIGTAATMGRPYSSTNIQLQYPGNVVDYAWPRVGSAGINALMATSSGAGGAPWASNPASHGIDAADLAAGYPILEGSISYTGSVITAQSQIDAFADARQALYAKSPTIPKAIVAGGQHPAVQEIALGDHATFMATSSYHPGQPGPPPVPGLVQDVRIIGWVVHPPNDQQAETTDLVLGGVSS